MQYKITVISMLILSHLAVGNTNRNLSVNDAVKIAIGNHPSIITDAITDKARGELLEAISPAPPQVALEYEGVPSGSRLSDYEERRLSFSQELEFPLKTILSYQKGKTGIYCLSPDPGIREDGL